MLILIAWDTLQYLETFNFVDMLNWTFRNRTVWSFNCVKTNGGRLIELLVVNINTWKYLTVYK